MPYLDVNGPKSDPSLDYLHYALRSPSRLHFYVGLGINAETGPAYSSQAQCPDNVD